MRQATWCPVHDSSTAPLWSSTTTRTTCSSSVKKPTSQSRSLSDWFADGCRSGCSLLASSTLASRSAMRIACSSLIGGSSCARAGVCAGACACASGAAAAVARTSAPAALAAASHGERDAGYAKVQILLPMKLNGIAKATAIACAGSSGTSAAWISTSRVIRLIPSARTLTVKKRAA